MKVPSLLFFNGKNYRNNFYQENVEVYIFESAIFLFCETDTKDEKFESSKENRFVVMII